MTDTLTKEECMEEMSSQEIVWPPKGEEQETSSTESILLYNEGYVICSEKRDLRGIFFINIEFLVCMDSPLCIEYIGEGLNRKCQSQAEL